MDPQKRARLEAAGWRLGSTQEFLGLSPAEAAQIELKIALNDKLKARRRTRRKRAGMSRR